MNSETIYITEKDYWRIKSLFEHYSAHDFDKENLEIELERASILADNEVPPNLVTMNTRLRFKKMLSGEERVVTLIYPSANMPSDNVISILSPLGIALIGLSLNQEINYQFSNNKLERLKILEILYQPEAEKHWSL